MKIKTNNLLIGLLTIALLISAFNSVQLMQIKSVDSSSGITGRSILSKGSSSSGSSDSITPTGVPKIYGKELGVSFDDVSPNNPSKADATIGVLKQLDKDITLSGADLDRYIEVLYNLKGGIACEFCCGAQSVIFADGRAACGCAHSYAMRGLTKYLITKHGNEYTDEELLAEAGKWKVLFFPGIMQDKADILKAEGINVNYISVASNEYRGAEKGKSSGGGGMVGGC